MEAENVMGKESRNSLDQIRDLINPPESSRSDEFYDESDERDQKKERRRATRRALGGAAVGILAVGLVGVGGSAALYVKGAADALAPHIDAHAGVVGAGKGTIEKISMDMPPITLATAETKVTGEKVAFEDDIKGFGLTIPVNQQTLTRDANVETLITLDPGKVEVSFDSAKDKLIYTIPDNDTTLTTKVHIPTGESRTADTSGSITGLPSAVATAMANSIAGTFGSEASSVPLLGGIAKGTTSVTNGLESFADLAITTGVDQKCTPKIKEIPGFTDQLDVNITTVMAGPVMAREDLPALMDKPLKDVRKIVDNPTIEMSTDYKIGPDQAELATFNKYLKSKFFSTDSKGVPPITCGVSKSAKLSLVDKGGKK